MFLQWKAGRCTPAFSGQFQRRVTPVTPPRWADVAVIGGGLAGLVSALSLADRGCRVTLVDDRRPGQASTASGGLLAPSIDPAPGDAGTVARAALERYPAFLDALSERSGERVALGRGLLHVADDEGDAERRRSTIAAGQLVDAHWLSRREAAELEPAIDAPFGAVLHARDGWVSAPALLRALWAAVAGERRIVTVRSTCVAVRLRPTLAALRLADGTRTAARDVVVAGGAWSPLLPGLPSVVPVRPLRGQMVEVRPGVVRHAVYGGGGYLVPHGDGTLVGATSDDAGFDASITPDGASSMRRVLAALVPGHAALAVARQWAGIRPMTPDGQPVIGRDPRARPVVYACGHSRNGVLLAAVTGDLVASLVCGGAPPVETSAFAPERFVDAR